MMMPKTGSALWIVLLSALLLAACGYKGDPLPPADNEPPPKQESRSR
ncbi:MAG: hypothetical protein IID18_07770 [Nitrospinae bacterium]|nr:hypothetical protein [Nitrospinota bacterium]